MDEFQRNCKSEPAHPTPKPAQGNANTGTKVKDPSEPKMPPMKEPPK